MKRPGKHYLTVRDEVYEVIDREGRRREARTGGKVNRSRIAEEWIKWAAAHMQQPETVS